MKALLRLALASAWNRRLSLGLSLLAVMLAASLLLSVERIRQAARDNFAQSLSGTDLVVGARTSPVQLVLYSVFRLGEATNNLSWDSYEQIARDPSIAWSVPISLGDSHRGYPVLGTIPAYFEHYRHGDKKALKLVDGVVFEGVFDAVLGAEVAQRLGYRVGDRITLSHGDGGLPGMEHDDKPFTVTGILAPTGTPVDRTVHVGLAAIEAIHLDWIGGAPVPGFNIAAEVVQKFDLTPKSITAFLVGLHQRAEVFRVQRRINTFAEEPLLAVMPGVALDQLWQTVGVVEKALQLLSWLVLAVGLAGLMATLLAGLNERRREMAILRSLGAGPRHVLALLMLESGVVSLLGCLAGLALVTLIAAFAGDALLAFGLARLPLAVNVVEMQLLAAVLVCGLLVGLVPAWRAYRLSLADGLIPRS
jgi:putative ABC transport system permease protein